MVLRNILVVLSLLTLVMNCSQNEYSISGNIKLTDEEYKPMVYLIGANDFQILLSSYEGEVLDSAEIGKNGDFGFNLNSKEEKIYLLAIQKKDENHSNKLENLTLGKENYIPFIFNGTSKIRIKSKSDSFLESAKISGGADGNKDIQKLISKRKELNHKFLNELSENDEENLLENEKALYDFQTGLVASAAESQNIFVHALSLRWTDSSGDYERIPELVKSTCERMSALDSNHPYSKQVCEIAENISLTPGDSFPDFILPMSDNTEANLKDLTGRLTIIDLWASWCGPCRVENKNVLVPLWEKHHDNGFQIIGYSLDADKQAWLNSIQKDGVYRWPHASHLGGDESPFMDELKISIIPANYIIDGDGKILAKNLHGEDLESFVNSYFEK